MCSQSQQQGFQPMQSYRPRPMSSPYMNPAPQMQTEPMSAAGFQPQQPSFNANIPFGGFGSMEQTPEQFRPGYRYGPQGMNIPQTAPAGMGVNMKFSAPMMDDRMQVTPGMFPWMS